MEPASRRWGGWVEIALKNGQETACGDKNGAGTGVAKKVEVFRYALGDSDGFDAYGEQVVEGTEFMAKAGALPNRIA